MRRADGFSMIELLIVIAVIMVIAALAIPKLLSARLAANEASAISSIKNILTAQVGYAAAYPVVGYADNLTKLAFPQPGQPVDQNAAGFLDWVLGCASQPCPKSGYKFAIINASGTPTIGSFTVTAEPLSPGTTGNRGFCADQTGTLSYDPTGGTNCTQPLIQ
jgi:type IV pilus assembly protein PilA